MVPSEAQTPNLTNICGMSFSSLPFVKRWYLLGSLFEVMLCILRCESFVKQELLLMLPNSSIQILFCIVVLHLSVISMLNLTGAAERQPADC